MQQIDECSIPETQEVIPIHEPSTKRPPHVNETMMSKAPQRQPRAFDRRPSDATVVLTPLDATAPSKVPVPATLCDVSAGGCRIRTATTLSSGSLWSIKFGAGEDSRSGTALIRWTSTIGPGVFQAGAQFLADLEILGHAGLSIDDLVRPQPAGGSRSPTPWHPRFDVNAPDSLMLGSIESASLSVGRDLSITQAITGCTIDIGGRLEAPSAVLAGGRVHVLGEANVGELGDESGSVTCITLGRSLSACLMLALVPAAIAERERDIKMLEDGIAEIKSSSKASSQDKEQITLWLFEIEEKRKQNARMLANAEVIRGRGTSHSRIRLTVLKRVHAGVTICGGDVCTHIARTIEGPVTFLLGKDGRLLCRQGDTTVALPTSEQQPSREAA